MDSARLLRLMGIDVWRQRRATMDAITPEQPINPPRVSEPRTPAPVPASDANQIASALIPKAAAAAQRPIAAEAISIANLADSAQAFSVVCLSVSGVLLIVDADARVLPSRFCNDLLTAISGIRTVTHRQVIFNWPQPGIEAAVVHSGRALSAFLDKQLSDSAPGLVTIDERVRERVPDLRWPGSSVFLPGLDRLVFEGDLKKSLWVSLQAARAALKESAS